MIQWCGLFAKEASATRYAWHNGEGVYIGTSPKSTDQPMYAGDTSSCNVVSGNVIHTYGSECVGVKENAHDNEFSGNDCAGNQEPTSFSGSGVELRGYDNVVRGNRVHDSAGYGLKLAADSAAYHQGGNTIAGNTFAANAGADISNKQAGTQGAVCGNVAGVTGGLLSLVGTAIGILGSSC